MKKKVIIFLMIYMLIQTLSYAERDTSFIVIPVEPKPVYIEKEIIVYVGAGLALGKYSDDCSDKCFSDENTFGAMLKVGYNFNEFIGLEARYINTILLSGDGENVQHLGFFLRPMAYSGDLLNVYGLFGYGWTQIFKENKNKEYQSGFSAGIGLEYALDELYNDEWMLFLDYQRVLIKSDVPSLDVITAGVTYDF